jgi:hypothetical protein
LFVFCFACNFFPGAVAELAEQRKMKAYSRLWNVESERARLIFFAVELSGCFGPEAQQMCKTVAEMGGGGPEALREVYESLHWVPSEQGTPY